MKKTNGRWEQQKNFLRYMKYDFCRSTMIGILLVNKSWFDLLVSDTAIPRRRGYR